jgi:hypothetical protein
MAGSIQLLNTTGWDKSLNRAAISSAIRSDQLINKIRVCDGGRLEIECIEWDDYWNPALPGLTTEVALQLHALGAFRKTYIASGYDLSIAPNYCQAYFSLLRSLLKRGSQRSALKSLLGLESFGITQTASDKAHAAGALTIRHPVYLLAKLREPKAYDDPKFLALICPHEVTGSGPAQLFYCYRQIKLQNDPSASLLIYPAVDLASRTESFTCIEAVASALSFKSDPRPRQRAEAIADWAIAPFLKHRSAHYNDRPDLSFADIGGGSGSLLSETSKQLIESHGALLHNRKFAWSIVDLCLQDTTRRTHSPELRRYMSYIDYQAVDYMAWIAEESIRSDCDRYDVVLICRLLNNLSRIKVEHSSSSDVATELTRVRKKPTSPNYHPADCLLGTAPDCESLITSNSRSRLLGGTTFRQASLSDYYQGLHLTSERSPKTQNYNGSLFFPLRRFNPDALVLPDGRSILNQLCRMANLIVIEDVDLTAELLLEHLKSKGLRHLAASDATNRIRMQSASLICVTRRELEAALPGRRIW